MDGWMDVVLLCGLCVQQGVGVRAEQGIPATRAGGRGVGGTCCIPVRPLCPAGSAGAEKI
eukprot:365091-Chlamydomonas_euryale.AAC.9